MGIINLLFGGGMFTKLAIMGLLFAFASTGASCAWKTVKLNSEINAVNKKNGELETKNGQLSTDNATLKSNIETLKSNLDIAADANAKIAEANRQLLNERKLSKEAIEILAHARDVATRNLQEANRKIDEMLKNPANNGALAPVLRETIRDIQNRNKK